MLPLDLLESIKIYKENQFSPFAVLKLNVYHKRWWWWCDHVLCSGSGPSLPLHSPTDAYNVPPYLHIRTSKKQTKNIRKRCYVEEKRKKIFNNGKINGHKKYQRQRRLSPRKKKKKSESVGISVVSMFIQFYVIFSSFGWNLCSAKELAKTTVEQQKAKRKAFTAILLKIIIKGNFHHVVLC